MRVQGGLTVISQLGAHFFDQFARVFPIASLELFVMSLAVFTKVLNASVHFSITLANRTAILTPFLSPLASLFSFPHSANFLTTTIPAIPSNFPSNVP
jgi:hypothetical protein